MPTGATRRACGPVLPPVEPRATTRPPAPRSLDRPRHAATSLRAQHTRPLSHPPRRASAGPAPATAVPAAPPRLAARAHQAAPARQRRRPLHGPTAPLHAHAGTARPAARCQRQLHHRCCRARPHLLHVRHCQPGKAARPHATSTVKVLIAAQRLRLQRRRSAPRAPPPNCAALRRKRAPKSCRAGVAHAPRLRPWRSVTPRLRLRVHAADQQLPRRGPFRWRGRAVRPSHGSLRRRVTRRALAAASKATAAAPAMPTVLRTLWRGRLPRLQHCRRRQRPAAASACCRHRLTCAAPPAVGRMRRPQPAPRAKRLLPCAQAPARRPPPPAG
eukprot:356023-Chlamydomonas_euryale.AAC.2